MCKLPRAGPDLPVGMLLLFYVTLAFVSQKADCRENIYLTLLSAEFHSGSCDEACELCVFATLSKLEILTEPKSENRPLRLH